MTIIRYILSIVSRIYLLVAFYPLLIGLKLLLWRRYGVKAFPDWIDSSHFCFLLVPRDGSPFLFLKVRNHLSSLYNRLSGRPQLTADKQVSCILSLSKEGKEVFPQVKIVSGMVAMHYFTEYQRLDAAHTSDDERQFVMEEVMRKLAIIHADGFVHGDVKAKNVLYSTKQKNVFLVDIDYMAPITPAGLAWEKKQEAQLKIALGLATNEKERS